MNKLVITLLLALSISMPIEPGIPRFLRTFIPSMPKFIPKNVKKGTHKNKRKNETGTHKDKDITRNKKINNNVKNVDKHLEQQIIFGPCKDEKMHKKLLENEKLIKQVLSKYPDLRSITISVNDEKASAHSSPPGICLDSDWFEEDDDIKQFILAYEATHITYYYSFWRILDGWGKKDLIEKKKEDSDSIIKTLQKHYILTAGAIGFLGGVGLRLPLIHSIGTMACCMAASLLIMNPNQHPYYHQKFEKKVVLMAVEKLGTTEGGIKFLEKFGYEPFLNEQS
jgi:hypothetical protein